MFNTRNGLHFGESEMRDDRIAAVCLFLYTNVGEKARGKRKKLICTRHITSFQLNPKEIYIYIRYGNTLKRKACQCISLRRKLHRKYFYSYIQVQYLPCVAGKSTCSSLELFSGLTESRNSKGKKERKNPVARDKRAGRNSLQMR